MGNNQDVYLGVMKLYASHPLYDTGWIGDFFYEFTPANSEKDAKVKFQEGIPLLEEEKKVKEMIKEEGKWFNHHIRLEKVVKVEVPGHKIILEKIKD